MWSSSPTFPLTQNEHTKTSRSLLVGWWYASCLANGRSSPPSISSIKKFRSFTPTSAGTIATSSATSHDLSNAPYSLLICRRKASASIIPSPLLAAQLEQRQYRPVDRTDDVPRLSGSSMRIRAGFPHKSPHRPPLIFVFSILSIPSFPFVLVETPHGVLGLPVISHLSGSSVNATKLLLLSQAPFWHHSSPHFLSPLSPCSNASPRARHSNVSHSISVTLEA